MLCTFNRNCEMNGRRVCAESFKKYMEFRLITLHGKTTSHCGKISIITLNQSNLIFLN